MKQAIIKEYIKLIVLSVSISVLLSAVLCFILFFYGDEIQEKDPSYLARSIDNYVLVDGDEIAVKENAKQLLLDNDLWLQIIDENGTAITSINTPGIIPDHYTNVELVDMGLHSGSRYGYTVFISSIKDAPGYGVLIGAKSDIVTKVVFDYPGSLLELIAKYFVVILFVSSNVVFFASFYFSRKITIPMSKALNDIEKVQNGESIDVSKEQNDKIFSDVFISISKLQEELKRNDKMRAEWIVNISHDIKTPLSTINGYAELMSSDDYVFDNNEVREYSTRILESCKNINELVEDLRISRSLDEGDIVLKKSNVDIVELIEETVKELEELHEEGNSPRVNCETRPIVCIDRKLMKRCLLNVIGNAYIHNGKRVDVYIDVYSDNSRVIITINDNGKGMSEDEKNRIFDRYYRGTNSQNINGSGLGLAIAKEIIRCHNGEITVESALDIGTKFVISL